MFKLKRFNQVQEGLSSQDFASGEFIMRYKRLIPADYLQIRSGQRINLYIYDEFDSKLKLILLQTPLCYTTI